MSSHERTDLDRVHVLMMAALDGECSADERRELEEHLTQPAIAAEWDRLRRVKEVTTTMTVRQPPEEIWDRYRVTALHRLERMVGWLLLLFGAAVLAGMSAWLWLRSLLGSDVPTIVKVAVVALIAGGVILLVSVIRERWFLYRRDPYSKEVMR